MLFLTLEIHRIFAHSTKNNESLYSVARLVHGDLSEYNILIAPASIIANRSEFSSDNDADELQIILIDFGQAVDSKHPGALELLERDIQRVNKFFNARGVEVFSDHEMKCMITAKDDAN